ncbi:MAG: hypothetical protein KGL95_14980 [Patescibacteria group bacterium]|nr:hypothetical protein [Patescibacteria group bacterium]
MKANFQVKKIDEFENKTDIPIEQKDELTEEEFEEYIRNSGSAGSFMVFRSDRSKETELGLDEI